MPLTRTAEATATDPRTGMTLDELAAFVQAALRDGASGTELVEVTTVGLLRPRIKAAKAAITSK